MTAGPRRSKDRTAVPESKRRKKPAKATATVVAKPETANPAWFAPVVFGLMLLGLAWVVVFYLTSGGSELPVPAIGRWNLAIGFALMISGFGMLTRWK
jgi:hypothetical protein